MGYGDVLLAAGQAQMAYHAHPERGPVVICDCQSRARWRPEWAGNPAIRPGVGELDDTIPIIRAGKGCSPWNPWWTRDGWRAQDQERARIYFTDAELTFAKKARDTFGPFVLIEPTGKDRKNPNRFWPSPNWHALAGLLTAAGLTVVQLARPACDRIPAIPGIKHHAFREALAILSVCRLAVLPEGGLAIGAASVGAAAVVLWGGNADSEVGAYPEHVNLVDDDPRTPCNATKPCDHCVEAWSRLTPEHVAAVVLDTLRQSEAA